MYKELVDFVLSLVCLNFVYHTIWFDHVYDFVYCAVQVT